MTHFDSTLLRKLQGEKFPLWRKVGKVKNSWFLLLQIEIDTSSGCYKTLLGKFYDSTVNHTYLRRYSSSRSLLNFLDKTLHSKNCKTTFSLLEICEQQKSKVTQGGNLFPFWLFQSINLQLISTRLFWVNFIVKSFCYKNREGIE